MNAETRKVRAAAHAWIDGARTARDLGVALGLTPGAAWGRLQRAQTIGLIPKRPRLLLAPAVPVPPGPRDVISVSRLPRRFPLLDRETVVTYHGHVVGTFRPADTPVPLTPDDVHALGIEPYEPHVDSVVELLRLAAEVARLGVDVEEVRGAPTDSTRRRAFQARRLSYLLAANRHAEAAGDRRHAAEETT